jgi:hypothetical protein
MVSGNRGGDWAAKPGPRGGHMRGKTVWTCYLTLLAFFLFLPVANAYLDPGSGSFFFQAAVAVVMAVSLGVKVFWRRIVSVILRRDVDKT